MAIITGGVYLDSPFGEWKKRAKKEHVGAKEGERWLIFLQKWKRHRRRRVYVQDRPFDLRILQIYPKCEHI